MNNILKILFLLPIILITSCNEDDYETPPSFTDLFITMSSGANEVRDSEVNQFFSFSDISAGALVTEWTIPDNSFFLEGPIPNNLPHHDSYIKEPVTNTSNEKTVSVLFKKGNSDTRIKYYGEFADSTSYRYNVFDVETNTSIEDTIATVNIDGKWIAEHEFSIDVYDTVVAKPEIRYLNETIIDYENTSVVTLNVGDKLIIEDQSNFVENNNARPHFTTWKVLTNEENEEDRITIDSQSLDREGDFEKKVIDTITFNTIGDYKIELLSRRSRTETLNESSDTFIIPTTFNVEP
ncbi:hypothetical protein FPF71_08915 [Algibacter amylolyticus]|uniref:Uncharacterized protein n=1 Tax=Algibacter amylolyticus TaxID=1608400 RepID=A0A5M7B5X4_9FLAO|nr:hypothetical protein [Algibacter amylolyticus]KAA5824792.1 hypothetical protein F2B50_08915 [Algibacter amylolyticus]MBB5268909.1 hypothetical protein [Algibacter amylolyticus]TSJ75957.1 hypothetical protein FPF71_08915 [Algibacter amylolyticus]